MKSNEFDTDIVIIGAGPVGLMCAHLAHLCGLRTIVLDRSAEPLRVGRADALNARTLQLLEVAGLFHELYPLGKACNTSSVWASGKFVSRQSAWWEALEGCFHKHFLMLGQSFVEKLLDAKLTEAGTPVRRSSEVVDLRLEGEGCLTTLANGDTIRSRYAIGADGAHSLVRRLFKVPFEIERPQIVWAVIDGVIETDFPKVPEIIVFQADTSDVAWIPREGNIDRFYVRMDTKDFTHEEALAKINRAVAPHTLRFEEITWRSAFSVKEALAERFSIDNRVFLAGDACHVHSVNGGQGLNTGLADAFNLVWKLNMVVKRGAPPELLDTYEGERKPVARSVIQASGELVRSTKYSESGTHAQDYVKIVAQRAGNITGMGIRYGENGLPGSRLLDFEVGSAEKKARIYSMLDYRKYTLLVFGEHSVDTDGAVPTQVLRISDADAPAAYRGYRTILVRPDAYIDSAVSP